MPDSRLPVWLLKRWGDTAFRIYFILFLGYIFLPLAVLVLAPEETAAFADADT